MNHIRIAALVADHFAAPRKSKPKSQAPKSPITSKPKSPKGKQLAPPPEFTTGLAKPIPKSTNLLQPLTEYSCHAELSISVDFEGDVAKRNLEKKFRQELMAAVKESMNIIAKEFNLTANDVNVQPIKFEIAVNDQGSVEDEMDGSPFGPSPKPTGLKKRTR